MSSGAVEELIARVPQWEGLELDVRPLHGGITNRNFVVHAGGREFVVRLPGERTELLGIDRANEAEAARRAAELGIGPPVLGDLPQVGTLITAYMPGRHLTDDQFAARLDEVVPLLKRLHDSGPLHGAFPIHRVVEWHARDATAHGVMAPSAYERLHQQSRRIERAFQANPMAPVPCHNDLLPGNVLFGDDADSDGDGSRVWLLDFEYAGMNDVFFDLGNLSVNAGLSTDAEEELLRLYFGTVSHAHLARLALMKVMSEFREGMWAVVQQAISTLDTDFVAYAAERLGNCERLVASPAFEQWLDDAARVADPD
jgi:thiamine kinase-like enzyme